MDSIIDNYHEQLIESVKYEEYSVVLSQIFYKLFNRTFNWKEQEQIGKLVKIYGKEIVFQSIIKASMVSTFKADRSSNVPAYLYKICQVIQDESDKSVKEVKKVEQTKSSTQQLIDELTRPRPKIQYVERDFNVFKQHLS